jgi:16S rRNA (cytosine967-C5)-methyltransferase
MRFRAYLNAAINILQLYPGKIPLHLFLKQYFSANKKFGSRDRKQVTSLCYNYFRTVHAVKNITIEESILVGTFLCENKPSEFLEIIKPEWNVFIQEPFKKKLVIINEQLAVKDIFPYPDELSKEINVVKFHESFLIQPDLFLRARPGNTQRVTGKLSGAGLTYKLILDACICLPNGSKVDTILELDKEAVVQDYNSQRVGDFFKLQTTNHKLQTSIWDCCAASGGKSIMAYDINPKIDLTVSDKRESILNNLHKRFARAGIKNYHSFIADLESSIFIPQFAVHNSKFDLIICDAPCSGSGTWSRTPEQLYYFKKKRIEEYSALQKKIIENIVPYVKPGGKLLYITCSVFKKENEDIAAYAEEKFKLILNRIEVLKGYEMKADTMFAALFTVPATL